MIDLLLRLLCLLMFVISLISTMLSFVEGQYIFMLVSAIISVMWWELFITFN